MKQIKHRVAELFEWQKALESGSALQWIFNSNTNSSDNSESKRAEQIQKSADALRRQQNMIAYVGHSFGASTSLIAAVERCVTGKPKMTKPGRMLPPKKMHPDTFPSRQLPPCVLLDLWWLLPELRFGMESGVFDGRVATRQTAGVFSEDSRSGEEYIDPSYLPDITIIDSQVWTQPGHDSRPYFNFLKKEWPKRVQELGVEQTDHIAVSDLGIFTPVINRSKKIVKYEKFTAEQVPALKAEVAWKALIGEF